VAVVLLPYWLGVPERCFYQDFQLGITAALREFGYETVPFPFAERGPVQVEESKKLYKQLQAGNFSAVLDLACWGYGLSRIMLPQRSGESQPIFDAFGVPYVQWLFDQPCNQQMTGVMAAGRYAIYPDLGHSKQVRLLYPGLGLTGEIFAPPAIRSENNRSAGHWSSARDIDVLYVGNLVPEALERGWNDRDNRRWPDKFSPKFCNALTDACLDKPERSLHLVAQAVIAALDPMPAGFNFRLHFSMVENFLRHTVRRDAIAALARSGVRMRVVGRGWDKLSLPANVELGAETDYDGLFRLAGQAKICLDASTYLDGANDRVFSYALNRAVCFTNASGYLRRVFGEDGGMRFFSLQDLSDLAEQVKSLLARPAALQEAGERAAGAVLRAHTWRHRIGNILSAMRLQSVWDPM
jgi:glycosyltransferase involved in cell wall biosynthesis